MTKTRYDENTRTLWVESNADEDTLIDESNWIKALKKGTYKGKEIKGVNIVFTNSQSAEYNSQPLQFAKLGVFVGDISAPKALDGTEVSFGTKDDFGI